MDREWRIEEVDRREKEQQISAVLLSTFSCSPYSLRPKPQSGWLEFEPTISCVRSTRNAGLSPASSNEATSGSRTPHIRHGKAVGCHYIIGTCCVYRIVKDPRAPGRTRTGVAALRVRSLRR